MIELQAGTDMTSDLFRMGALSTRNVVADYEAWIIPFARDLVAAGTCHSASVPDLPRAPSVRGNATDPVPDGRAHAVADENAWPPQRVAVDTMGGACTDIAPRVLAAAGYHVVTVDPQLDADFERRDPNPAQDRNLQQLIEAVLQQQADVGLALDGDGDRVIFVDGLGHIARPEQIAALLVEHCFPGSTVVFDLKCASLVPRTVRAHGGTPVMQPSGHGFIKSTMLDRQAQLGVEVSGHHFFGVLQGGDDGLFTALVVLELLRRRRLSLQAHVERIGWPSITPDLRVPFTGDSRAALELIAAHCGGQISRMDGVRAEYPDGWALARVSITEPAMTFRFEGHKDEHVRRVVTRFLAGVPELRQQLLERIS